MHRRPREAHRAPAGPGREAAAQGAATHQVDPGARDGTWIASRTRAAPSGSAPLSRAMPMPMPMPIPNQPNRRRPRSILQNRRAQLIHALLIVTYLVVYTAVLSAAALGPTVLTLLTDPGRFEGAPDRALAAAAELFLFEERVWPLALLLILACGIHALHVSHRVFGPLARVRKEAPSVAAGDLRHRFRFRRNDHMSELGEALNQMVAGLEERMAGAQSAAARCRAQLEELERAQFGSARARQEAIATLGAGLSRLDAHLAAFQTAVPAAPVRDPEASACDELESRPQSAQA